MLSPSWARKCKWGYMHQRVTTCTQCLCIGMFRSWLCPIWMKSIHSCLISGCGIYGKYMDKVICHLAAIFKNEAVHQWTTIDNVHTWPCPCNLVLRLTEEWSILTKSKIGPTAIILDRTKILLHVHQGPTISHDCAQYEWNPFIHVWDSAAESFPYVKHIENIICHLAAILDQNFKTRQCASMGYYRQCSCMTMSM